MFSESHIIKYVFVLEVTIANCEHDLNLTFIIGRENFILKCQTVMKTQWQAQVEVNTIGIPDGSNLFN